jgi:hypothetical protein
MSDLIAEWSFIADKSYVSMCSVNCYELGGPFALGWQIAIVGGGKYTTDLFAVNERYLDMPRFAKWTRPDYRADQEVFKGALFNKRVPVSIELIASFEIRYAHIHYEAWNLCADECTLLLQEVFKG